MADDLDGRVDALLEDASNFEARYVRSYPELAAVVEALRHRGRKLTLTSGSFDILHEGHSMYLEAARNLGDFLVVGVDSDEKIRGRKGPGRPAVPELERLRMLTHQRGVGIVFLKEAGEPRWELIRTVQPDVLVTTEETYSKAEIDELEAGYCGRVEVLSRMATISTSARLRLLQLGIARGLAEQLAARLPELIARITDELVEPCPRSN